MSGKRKKKYYPYGCVHRYKGVEGTILVALPIKVIYCTYVCDKKILHRSVWRSMRIFIPNYLLFGITIIVNHAINLNINNLKRFKVTWIVD